MNTRFDSDGQLSAREREMLLNYAHGMRDKESAEATGLSKWSVSGYIRRGMKKLGAGTRGEAVWRLRDRGEG